MCEINKNTNLMVHFFNNNNNCYRYSWRNLQLKFFSIKYCIGYVNAINTTSGQITI